MALETFTPPRAPSVGSDDENELRVAEARFGDGYSQRWADGLNPLAQTFNVVWNRLYAADAATIVAFFLARGGSEAFWWTPPDEAAAIKVTCKRWRRTPRRGGKTDLTAVFERRYDQGS